MFLNTCSVWAATPWGAKPVAGSTPTCPETNTRLPTLVAGL